MNRPKKQEPAKREGAPPQSALPNNVTTHNVAPAATGSKVALCRLLILSANGGANLLGITQRLGSLPPTAERRSPRGVSLFFAVPAAARSDDPRILGAGLHLDVVNVSRVWAQAVGAVAPAPRWLERLLVPAGGAR